MPPPRGESRGSHYVEKRGEISLCCPRATDPPGDRVPPGVTTIAVPGSQETPRNHHRNPVSGTALCTCFGTGLFRRPFPLRMLQVRQMTWMFSMTSCPPLV